MATLTIELRVPDGSAMTTLRLLEANSTWYDIDKDNSPLTKTEGDIDYEPGSGQFKCKNEGTEIVRLVNIDWLAPTGRNGEAFCYGCKTGYDNRPRWYCVKVTS